MLFPDPGDSRALDGFQPGAQGQVLRSLSVGLVCVSRSLFK